MRERPHKAGVTALDESQDHSAQGGENCGADRYYRKAGGVAWL